MFTTEEVDETPIIDKVKKGKEIKRMSPEIATGAISDIPKSKSFRLEDHTVILFDLETTGFNMTDHRVIQIAAKVLGEDEEMFNAYVLPVGSTVSNEIARLTGITQEFLNLNGMHIEDALNKFNDWITYLMQVKFLNKKVLLAGHNAKKFDIPFLKSEMQRFPSSHISLNRITCFDSLSVLKDKRIWEKYEGSKPLNFKLVTIYSHVMNSDFEAHNAQSDVIALENCLLKLNFQSVVEDHLFLFN